MPTRNPYLAVLLSILTPGVGHVYAGEWQRGLLFFVISLSWPLLGLLSIGYTFIGVVILTVVNIGLRVYGLVDAFWCARRNRFKPWARYNRWYIHSGLIVANLLSQTYYPLYEVLGVQSFRAASPSMLPTVKPGDVLVSVLRRHKNNRLAYGDVVTFYYGDSQWISRVVGRPGDRLRLQDDFLTINNRSLPHRMVGTIDHPDQGPLQEWQETLPNGRRIHIYRSPMHGDSSTTHVTVVPPGRYLLISDNRDNSFDGRYQGAVSQDSVTGVIRYTLYGRSVNRINVDIANQ